MPALATKRGAPGPVKPKVRGLRGYEMARDAVSATRRRRESLLQRSLKAPGSGTVLFA